VTGFLTGLHVIPPSRRLLAAFEPEEIQAQLRDEGLAGLSVRSVSDRHVIISGRMPG